MSGAALRRMVLHCEVVSPKTRWVFVQIEDADGRIGSGEASLNGKESALAETADRLAARALQSSAAAPAAFAAAIKPRDLVLAALVSAIDQALWDLHAQNAGVRLVDALGGARREAIALYANINRRTVERSPQGFARSARDAWDAGFRAFKVAPFDEVDAALCTAGGGEAAMQAGLARVAAVRAQIGPACRLMVDCHWRFDEATAARLIIAAAASGVYWIECPLPEIDAHIAALVRLRGLANARGIRLAGMEQGIGFDAFRPYCAAGAYDVMMPDVKYMGGFTEMLRAAEAFADYGVAMSPHNPSGPIAHAASLQVGAAMASFDLLELQFDESPLFDTLGSGDVPARVAGASGLPMGPGLGVRLDAHLLQEHADCAVRAWEAP